MVLGGSGLKCHRRETKILLWKEGQSYQIPVRYNDTMPTCRSRERESEQETRHQQVPITVFDVSFIILPSTNVVDDINIPL